MRGVAAENKPENNSFESQLKACLSNQIKVSLANIHEIVGLDRKVDNPTQLLVNVLSLAGNSNNPTLNLDQRKRNSMVYELVSFLEMELKAVITELKLSEETEESTDDNAENPTMFDPHGDPPDLMPQVDGVDSSAEGKSDDPKDQDDQENNTEAMEEELNLVSANENSNEISSSSSSSASSVTQAAENSSSANNSTTPFQNNSKCDKLKILSEMFVTLRDSKCGWQDSQEKLDKRRFPGTCHGSLSLYYTYLPLAQLNCTELNCTAISSTQTKTYLLHFFKIQARSLNVMNSTRPRLFPKSK